MNPIAPALAALRSGLVAAYPTETYYGLGADARDPGAAAQVCALKGRPPGEPLPLVLPDASWLERVATTVPGAAMVLARAFWPGPLTLIVPAAAWVPEAVHAGTGTVGVRVSPHPVATALARELGAPLTATSANRSGEPPARHPDEVRRAFPEIVVVDGGETRGGPPSTVVDLCVQPARLLRPGAVPWEEIARVLGAGRS